jgi:4-hydroxy-tetrahydrodipicolinate synthase
VTAEMSRRVYDDFNSGKKQSLNQKLCDVRSAFDKYNLISGLHTYCSQENKIYKNILPPLSLLNKTDEKDLINTLKDLNFTNKSSLAA